MPESRMIRYVNHEQALRMKERLDHAIAMIRGEMGQGQDPAIDPRGVDAELVMLLVRTAAMMGMDLTNGAAETIARLEAELELAKMGAVRRSSESVSFANGSHNGTATVDAFALASRSYARHTHPVDCGCSLCEGTGA